ncbi:hypothetical protein ACFYSW_25155 [Rhodococcus aetherivorans]|uniref:hypothetical protein n=1 Tax=Rhodococcus aetherivorans TaxID=191292 RepID=UPI003688EA07
MANDRSTSDERLDVVVQWIARMNEIITVGDMKWDEALTNLRSIAVNYTIRRQLEALDAAVALAKAGLGHLAVGFIRPALDELLWIAWFKELSVEDAQRLLTAMNLLDSIRSVRAQRDYIGHADMEDLWYPATFLNGLDRLETEAKNNLKDLAKEFGWSGAAPSAKWVAEKSDNLRLYEYLHSATSRALHYSMGEASRNCWGELGGIATTLKPEFRQHRTDFAMTWLPRLLLLTATTASDLLKEASIGFQEGAWSIGDITEPLNLSLTPLVHAYEWNLRPPSPRGPQNNTA